MAQKSRRAKLQISLYTPTGSLLPLCGGEHGPELLHREGEAAGTSARRRSGGLGKSQSEPRPTSKEPATLSTAARLASGSTSAWMSGAIDALTCPRQLAAVLTSRSPAIIMVARVCLRSWNAQLRPFTLRRVERSLPSRAGLRGRPPPPRSWCAGVAARHSRLVRHALGVAALGGERRLQVLGERASVGAHVAHPGGHALCREARQANVSGTGVDLARPGSCYALRRTRRTSPFGKLLGFQV